MLGAVAHGIAAVAARSDVSNNFLSGPIAGSMTVSAGFYGAITCANCAPPPHPLLQLWRMWCSLLPQRCAAGYFRIDSAVWDGGGSFGSCAPNPVRGALFYVRPRKVRRG